VKVLKGDEGVVNAVMSLQDAEKLLEKEISDPDMLLAAKEQLAQDIAADPTVLKDKSWLENIIKGNRYEAATFAAYETEGTLLRSFEKEVGVAEGYLSKQNGFTHLRQIQVNIGNGNFFIADDVWVKSVTDINNVTTWETYLSESKLQETTSLSLRQGEFSQALQNGTKEFTIRSTDPNIIGTMKPNSTLNIKATTRINGPDINNSTFTKFK